MAINVNTVYRTVLLILNKEQRGYLTPDEFNKIASQVQLEIFRSYIDDYNQLSRTQQPEATYADRISLLQEKISIFEKTVTSNLSGPSPITLPTDLYKIGSIVHNGANELQKIQKSELYTLNQSPLTAPTIKHPVYYTEGNTYVCIPVTTGTLTNNYIKVPADVVWNFTIPSGQNYYEYDSSGSIDFEIHVSEQTEVILKILLYAGVVVKDYNLVNLAAQEIQSEEINQKS
jgi:hypothetical protein